LLETLEELSAKSQGLSLFQWTSFLDLIEAALRRSGLSYLRLDGSTADRQAVVEAFQQDGAAKILIMSLKAAASAST